MKSTNKTIVWLYAICSGIFGLFGYLILIFIVLFCSSEWLFPWMWGSYNLGNNLYKLDDDDHSAIYYCSQKRGRTCYGGSYIVPEYIDVLSAEYVADYRYDDSYVIVLTDNRSTREHKYYIISKDFDPTVTDDLGIRARYLWEFTDSNEFIARCEKDGIALRF